ncbi:MAG: membrane protein insertion efficiency factor YidD [Patescibacteria group bacterium]
MSVFSAIINIPRKIVSTVIFGYQKTLSPDHGQLRHLYPHGFCRFYPSCSEYCRQAVLKYGVSRGIVKGVVRIVRCNPFSKGGCDVLR